MFTNANWPAGHMSYSLDHYATCNFAAVNFSKRYSRINRKSHDPQGLPLIVSNKQ